MPGGRRDVADIQNRFSPEMSARRECELLRLLTEEGTEQMRRLWLRKCSNTSNLYQHAAGQPSHRRAAARPPAQQNAGRQPEPAPAQAQAVPKPKTAAQLARRQRSLIRLQHRSTSRARSPGSAPHTGCVCGAPGLAWPSGAVRPSRCHGHPSGRSEWPTRRPTWRLP